MIESREKTHWEYWWTCPRCGYFTGVYGNITQVEYKRSGHKQRCDRAAELGLVPIFDNSDPFLLGTNQQIVGWRRQADDAELEIHTQARLGVAPCETLHEAQQAGWTTRDWDDNPRFCTRLAWRCYTEVRFTRGGELVETYEVPETWDWAIPGTEIPWEVK